MQGVLCCLGLFMVVACRPTRNSSGDAAPVDRLDASNVCSQKIKYYVSKIKSVENGEEVSANTELIIDPTSKTMTLSSKPPNQERVKFVIQIESIDCNLNTGMTSGQSTYKGYIKQTDGTTIGSTVKLEAKEDGLTITGGDPEQPEKMVMSVTKWEVLGN